MEALLAGSVPNLISEHAVLESALLREEGGADGGFLVCLEFVIDLRGYSGKLTMSNCWQGGVRTNRITTEDLPTADSPAVE